MNQEVKITNKEWNEITKEVASLNEQATANHERLNRHSKRIDELENDNLTLPMMLEKAIKSAMTPVMTEMTSLNTRIVEQNNKINELENAKYKNAYSALVKIAWAFASVIIAGLATMVFKYFFG